MARFQVEIKTVKEVEADDEAGAWDQAIADLDEFDMKITEIAEDTEE